MKEFIEKLIEKMQGVFCDECTSCSVNQCDGVDKEECSWMVKIKQIVNELAEEYINTMTGCNKALDSLHKKILSNPKMCEIVTEEEIKALIKAKEFATDINVVSNNGWIPCSERLPDNFTECLVTLSNGGVFQAKYIVDEFMRICEHEVTGFYENNKVIAWQPLPAPYKEGE